jgi:subtilase family serine protease
VINTGPASSCLPNCDQVESDLDVQYITAMGTGVETIFRAYPGNEFTAEFAMDLASGSIPANEVAYIYSISYGTAEIGNENYVSYSETQMAKLPALGITVFVSSGDDGAPNPPIYGSNGNCPLDTSFYCPAGGCTYTTTQCGAFIVSTSNGSAECIYPVGVGYQSSEISQGCNTIFSNYGVSAAFQNWATSVSSSCTIAGDTDAAGRPWFYSSCSCSALGGSYSNGGLIFTPYTFNVANGNALTPSYPASSAWVTSVGATQFIGSSAPYSEVAASILNNPPALITTGGGFSTLQSRPSWQDSVVSNYLATATLPPSTVFNSAGRAYPDVSFNGHNYVVYLNLNGGGNCNPYCNSTEVDGTSASSPGIAGLFALINDQLIANGDNTLGFLNPLLYSMAAADSTTFNDITVGNNKASSGYPCIYGFTTAVGWDPVTGLGSPNFGKILAYILAHPPSTTTGSSVTGGATTTGSATDGSGDGADGAAVQLYSWLHFLN